MSLEESGGNLGSRGEVDEGEEGLGEAGLCALGSERGEDLQIAQSSVVARVEASSERTSSMMGIRGEYWSIP